DEEAEDEDLQDPLPVLEVTDVPTRILGSVPTAFYDTLTSLTEGSGGYEDDDDLSLPLAHFSHDVEFIDELSRAVLRSRSLGVSSPVRKISHNQFKLMSASSLGEIFRTRSILVTDVEGDDTTFKEAVQSLGAPGKQFQMLGE
ncbi:hypothetical protein DXG01_014974, partial [Tephrocybe rancida]